MAVSQQQFYSIQPPADRMLEEGILILLRMMKFSLDAKGGDPNCSKYDEAQPLWLLRSDYFIVSGPHWTGC